nr:HNH endonuclease signature motif containing protein [Hymenobacter piscis]
MVATRANNRCEYCRIHEDDTFLGCQIDHVISEKHGGPTTAENLAYACAFCNRNKGSDIASLAADGTLTRLFHPRIDDWSTHFVVVGNTIQGRSTVGQVTAQLLGFNVPERLLERESLRETGRFP